MRYTAAAAAGALALAWSAATQNVVSLDLGRGIPGIRGGPPPRTPLSKRDFHAGSINNNITGGGYYMDVQVGTPGQPMTMVLDTGSSDVWFLSYQADLCTSKSLQNRYGDTCGPTFNPTKSSTYGVKVRDGFGITYIDGTSATGSYIIDNLRINGVTVESQQMGMAIHVVRGVGILGVGFQQNVAAAVKYPTIIDSLADQGLINSRAFSLYLNDRRTQTGTLLLGGVDKSKFIGPLHVLPIMLDGTRYTHYEVAMSSLSTTYSNGTKVPLSTTVVGAILDSGSTLSYLPDDIATPLFNELGVYTDFKTSGFSMIDCDLLNSEPDLVVTFGFGGSQAPGGGNAFTISVPVTELVLDLLSAYGDITAGAPFENVCLFGVQSSGGGFGGGSSNDTADVLILGDTFLRSAYVVYDQDHHQLGIAQANLNATGPSDIQELTSAGSSLPSLTGVSAQQTPSPSTSSSSSTRTRTSTSRSGGSSTTTTSRGAATNNPSQSGTESGAGGGAQNTGSASPSPSGSAASSVRAGGADAMAVAVVAGVFAVLGGALFML
jgi:hypothetical protein